MRLNWEEARYFLAVARTGQLKRAAAQLGISTITLSRHLAHLQSQIAAPLFHRHPKGLRLTDEGSRLLVHVERIEAEFEEASDTVFGSQGQGVSGTVRIAAPEGFALAVLVPNLKYLYAIAPDLRIEVVPQIPGFSLSRREADVAVMVGRPTDRHLLCESLGLYQLGVYASLEYLTVHGRPETVEDLEQHVLIGYVEDLLYSQSVNLATSVWSNWQSQFSVYSPIGQVNAVRSGLGIGVLHEFLITPQDELVQLLPEVQLEREFYLVTHQNLQRIPRVRAVMRFLKTLTDFAPEGVLGVSGGRFGKLQRSTD